MTDDDRQRAAETPAGDRGEARPRRSGRAEPAPPSRDGRAASPRGDGRALPTPAEPTPPRPGRRGSRRARSAHWWDELKAIFWLLLAVLAFHSCVAKPFYIPSESMMPGLLKGDRLVVSKYPYGWSWVSPSFHIFPHWQGRIWGAMPRARRHRHRHPARRQLRLYQARDRPARRHDRGDRRRGLSERPRAAARGAAARR